MDHCPWTPQKWQAWLHEQGGFAPFDAFMQQALYHPGWGYYASGRAAIGQIGRMHTKKPDDFVTAPTLSPWFARTLAVQVKSILKATCTHDIWEFGPGTGHMAQELLEALGADIHQYHLIEVSAALRDQQQARLAAYAGRTIWHDSLPSELSGVVVANEVLDAMPVKLLHRLQGQWHERGVTWGAQGQETLVWEDRPTHLTPPCEIEGEHDYLTEIHPLSQAWIQTLAQALKRGAALIIDYGFDEQQYYHPQRSMGTLICHHEHRVDDRPLLDIGNKDITAHVNFTNVALAAQGQGQHILGYTSQGRFLLNCGLATLIEQAPMAHRIMAHRLIAEHEMGELFKILAFGPEDIPLIGFAQGDRTHTL